MVRNNQILRQKTLRIPTTNVGLICEAGGAGEGGAAQFRGVIGVFRTGCGKMLGGA